MSLDGLAPEGSLIATLHRRGTAATSIRGLLRRPGGDQITKGSMEAELGRNLKFETQLLVYEI